LGYEILLSFKKGILMNFLIYLFILSSQLLASDLQDVDAISLGCNTSIGIKAPKGWVLDQKKGQDFGLCGFYYQKDSNFDQAAAVSYAKITGHKTTTHLLEDALSALSSNKNFKYQARENYTNKSKLIFEVHEFLNGPSPNNFEIVAYHQLKDCVALVAYSAKKERDFKKELSKFYEILENFKVYSNTVKPLVGSCLYPLSK
jgi:hypothetical protein